MVVEARPPLRIILATAGLLLMPIFWLLGVDQAMWLLVALLLGLGTVGAPRTWFARVAAAFIFVFIASGILGASGIRWWTFARDLMIALAFFATVIGTRSLMFDRRALLPIALGAIGFYGISALGSVVTFAVQTSPSFTTVLAPLVPPVIANTGLGDLSLVHRSLAESSYFLGLAFDRPKGLFLFSTSQALAASAVIPFSLYIATIFPRWRVLAGAVAVLALLALLVSTTRGPLLALFVAGLLVWIVRRIEVGEITLRLSLRGWPGVALAVVVVLVPLALLQTGVLSPAVDILTTRSLAQRDQLYRATIVEWSRRPLIGWGTERDWTPAPTGAPTPTPLPTPSPSPTASASPLPTPRPDQIPPLGSHSQYLGVLFKQGVVGLGAYLGLMIVVAAAGIRLWRRRMPGGDWLLIGLTATFIAAATEELWLDPATAFLTALVWGAVLALGAGKRAYE